MPCLPVMPSDGSMELIPSEFSVASEGLVGTGMVVGIVGVVVGTVVGALVAEGVVVSSVDGARHAVNRPAVKMNDMAIKLNFFIIFLLFLWIQ